MATCTDAHGSSQNQKTRNIGPSVRICQLNIEGISRAKCQYLSKLLQDKDIDLVVIQETHLNDETELCARGMLPGYEILAATYDRAYGNATYIRSTIENAVLIDESSTNNIHVITIQIGEVTVTNVYKPQRFHGLKTYFTNIIIQRFTSVISTAITSNGSIKAMTRVASS